VGHVRTDDMLACLDERRDRSDRRHPGGESPCPRAAFEHRQVLFEGAPRWILRARVLVTSILAESLLNVGRGLIDRNGNRAGLRIRSVARVDAIGSKAHGYLD